MRNLNSYGRDTWPRRMDSEKRGLTTCKTYCTGKEPMSVKGNKRKDSQMCH
jgi:hypothetical protein